MHEDSAGLARLTETWVQKLICIPGLYVKESKKGKLSRMQNFQEATEQFPYLFKSTVDRGFLRLDLQLSKLNGLLERYGRSCFGD